MLKSLATCKDWPAGGYDPRTNDELRHALLAPWTEVEGQKPSDDRVAGEDPRSPARTFTASCSKKATILNKVPVGAASRRRSTPLPTQCRETHGSFPPS